MTGAEQLKLAGRILRRSWWIIVTTSVVFGAGVALLSAQRTTTYQASTAVLLNRQNVADQLSGVVGPGAEPTSFQQLLITQTKVAQTPTVLRGALLAAGPAADGLTIDSLLAASTVEAEPSTDILRFAVTDSSVANAKRLSLAYAQSYLEFRLSLDTQGIRAAIADARTALAAAQARGRSGRRLADTLRTRLNSLQSRAALQTANAQILAGPQDAPKVGPVPLRDGFVGLVLGFALGLLIAFVRYALDTKIKTADDAEGILSLPTLAHVDLTGDDPDSRGLLMLRGTNAAAAESFRLLRTNLTFGLRTHGTKTILVTSSLPAEGKSTTVANLATAFALNGRRVVLVDMDLRRPTVAGLFETTGGAGLSGVVVGDAPLEDALVRIELPSEGHAAAVGELWVLPAGPLPPDPSEFLGGEGVDRIAAALADDFDLVILDAPPLVGVSDGAVVSRLADAVLVCVRAGVADRNTLTALRRGLERIGLPDLGLVLIGKSADRSVVDYYGYYGVAPTPAVSEPQQSAH